MHGILNCYKPPGQTSRDVVNAVYNKLKPAKVGHAGTLDPLAEGVLVVTVGAASRLVPYLHLYPKTYQATFQLGCQSASGDLECPLTHQLNPPKPSREQIEQAAAALTGIVRQVPPLHSAIKVNGKRAYKAARAEREFDMPARHVSVYRFEILSYDYPFVKTEIECGTGTYVRTLGIDLAASLETIAVMTHLLRSAIGPFSSADALLVERTARGSDLASAKQQPSEFVERFRPLADGTRLVSRIDLDPAETVELEFGRTIRLGMYGEKSSGSTVNAPSAVGPLEWAAYDGQGALRAILVRRNGGLGPKRVFPA